MSVKLEAEIVCPKASAIVNCV